MGQGHSSGAYDGAAEFYADQRRNDADDSRSRYVSGAGDCCGGADGESRLMDFDKLALADLSQYDKSLNSFVKDSLSADIVEALKSLGFKSSGESREDQIQSILKQLPNQKNNKNFKADADSQRQVCLKIADVVNKRYGKIIDERLPSDVICQQVSDIVASLKGSMHAEFLRVFQEVKTVLRNLNVLQGEMSSLLDPLAKEMAKSSDPIVKGNAHKMIGLYASIEEHIKSQLRILENLLNVTLVPSERTLADLIKNDKERGLTITKLKDSARPGTSAFSEYMAAVLSGVTVTPAYAEIVNKALKTVGLTINDYAKMKLPELTQKFAEASTASKDDRELQEIIESWDLLYKNFSRATNIAAIMEKSKSTQGAYELEPTSLDKKVKSRRIVRNLVFATFSRQLNEHFMRIVKAIDAVSTRLGNTIAPSEPLDSFVKSLDRLFSGENRDLLTKKTAYVSLIGYYNDAATKQRRDTFLASLRILLGNTEALVEMSQYRDSAPALKDLADSVRAMTALIEGYSEKVAHKLGGDDDEETCMQVEGSADWEAFAAPSSQTIRTAVELQKAIDRIKYTYKVSHIRSGLSRVATENERYADEYIDIRADAVAKRITALMADKRQKLVELSADKEGKDATPYLHSGKSEAEKKKLAKLRQATIKLVERQYDARINMWKTIEAVDEYMRVFTNGLVKDPNAVRDLKSMLDETESLSDWYNDNVGKKLHQVFDSFPAYIEGAGVTDAERFKPHDKIHSPNGHYYEGVGEAYNDVTNLDIRLKLPGNPYIVADPDPASEVGFQGKAHAKEMLNSLFAIKNLIACFTYIGQKFAGEEIRKKVFMSPTQMYKNLVEYLDASAFGMGLDSMSYIHDASSENTKDMHVLGTRVPGLNAQSLEARIAALEMTPWVQKSGRSPNEMRLHKEAFDNLRDAVATPIYDTSIMRKSILHMLETIPVSERMRAGDKSDLMEYITKLASVMGDASRDNPLAKISGTNPSRGQLLERIIHLHNYASDLASNPDVSTIWNRDYIAKAAQSSSSVDLTALDTILATLNGLRRADNSGLQPGNTYYQGGALDSFAQAGTVDTDASTYKFTAGNLVSMTGGTRNSHVLVRLGVTACAIDRNDPVYAQCDFRRRFGIYMRSTIPEFSGSEEECEQDQFFARVIKAMAAKILTIVGMYDLLDRPESHQTLSPIRMILGAAEPRVEPNAVELYLRLPLLLEFYRDLFGFSSSTGDHSWAAIVDSDEEEKISMIPEVEGVFAGLVRLLFKKSKSVSMMNLSDQDLRDIIAEVNTIYEKNASKGDSMVQDVAQQLVDEMNRRYGIIKKRFRDRYENEFGYRYDYDRGTKFGDELPFDIAILPDEEDILSNDGAAVAAPSDRYTVQATILPSKGEERKSKNNISREHYRLFYRFRCMLDNYFRDASGKAYGVGGIDDEYGFRPALKNALADLKGEQSNEERFKIVARLIRGYSGSRRLDLNKYIMFHETVVTGLNTLSAVYTLLARFKNRVLASDLSHFVEYLKAPPTGITANAIAVQDLVSDENYSKQNADLINAVDKYLRDVGRVGRTVRAGTVDEDMRMIFNYPLIMHDLLDMLSGLGNDLGNLVRVDFSGDRISINWSGLREAIEQTFAQIRTFMDLLRPHINADLFNSYVDKRTAGSFYWLQEQLIDKILVGRDTGTYENEEYTTEADRYTKRVQYLNLDQLTAKLNNTYLELTRQSTQGGAEWNVPFGTFTQRVMYDQVLAGMIFYDAKREQSGIESSVVRNIAQNSSPALVEFSRPINQLLLRPQGDKWIFFPNQSNRYAQLYSMDNTLPEWTGNNSLLFGFNQLIAKMIGNFWDPAVGKVYLTLFNALINGPLNAQIMNPDDCYPDTIQALRVATDVGTPPGAAPLAGARLSGSVGVVVAAGGTRVLVTPSLVDNPFIDVQPVNGAGVILPGTLTPVATPPLYSFGSRADPKPSAILYSSLALMLKNIASGRNKQGLAVYAAENIADVSMYIKDKMRAQLPGFKNLFNEIIRKGELLKAAMSKRGDGELNLARNDGNVLTVMLTTPGMYGLSDVDLSASGADGSHKTAAQFTAIVDAISKGCASAIAGIDQVLRELADSPKYLELNNGFLNEYRNMYKREPFTPLSSLLTVVGESSDHTHLPIHDASSVEGKLAFGERGVLGAMDQRVDLESMPGWKQILDAYNAQAGRDSISKEAAEKYTTGVVSLLRYVNEVHQLRTVLSTQYGTGLQSITSESLVASGNPLGNALESNVIEIVLSTRAPNPGQKYAPSAYAVVNDLSKTVDLTENSMRDQKLRELSEYVHKGQNNANDPKELKVRNILDLNIVPINVHAMMRDIPLVNLYNYSYTFDRLVIELLYGIQTDVANNLIKHLCANVSNVNDAGFRDGLDRHIPTTPDRGVYTSALRSTKDLFLALLINPYRELLTSDEYQYLAGIFTGDNDMDLGRPKFLSDQVYNKALFMELYPNPGPDMYQERGPRKNISGNPQTLTYITNAGKNGKAGVNDDDDLEFDYDARDGNIDASHGLTGVRIDKGYKTVLGVIGKLRTQTVFVRNLIFLVNVYRLLRLKMRKDLVYSRNLVVKGHATVRESDTEFARNQTQKIVSSWK